MLSINNNNNNMDNYMDLRQLRNEYKAYVDAKVFSFREIKAFVNSFDFQFDDCALLLEELLSLPEYFDASNYEIVEDF